MTEDTPQALSATRAEAVAGNVAPIVELLWDGKVHLDNFQIQGLEEGLSGRIVEWLVKGCVGCGKSFVAALLACIWLAIHPHCRVVVTSQRYEHAKSVLFFTIAKLWRMSQILMMIAEPGREGIFIDEDRFLLIASPESGEGFSGMHSEATLFLYDEASSVPDAYIDLGSTQALLSVLLSNPRRASGRFRQGFPVDRPNETCIVDGPYGKRLCQTIRGSDCHNVITGSRDIPGQLTRERYEGLLKHHSARWVAIFANGEFPLEDSEQQIILPSWLERHVLASLNPVPVWAFGADVADSDDGDTTVLAAGGPAGCRELHMRQKSGTMETVGWILSTAKDKYNANLQDGTWPVCVDADGLGVGVADRLIELGVYVIKFRGSMTPADPRTFANWRAEAWGLLGRRLDRDGIFSEHTWALPNDPELFAELCAPERIYQSDGVRHRITPKTRVGSAYDGECLREKLGRSPDRADAVVYLYIAQQVAYALQQQQADYEISYANF